MRIILAASDNNLKRMVQDSLTTQGYYVVAEAGNAADVLRKARSMHVDLVIMETGLPGGRIGEVAMILEEDGLAPVLMITGEKDPEIRDFNYILKPVNPYALIPAVKSASLAFRKRQELRREVERLKDQLGTRKSVDIAKGLLMQGRGLSEDDAHKAMQKMSMDRGLPLKKVAEAIIAAKDNL
ncbi:MAG: ANTAR domain-containing response regulator [Ignavibacteriales bacterium]